MPKPFATTVSTFRFLKSTETFLVFAEIQNRLNRLNGVLELGSIDGMVV